MSDPRWDRQWDLFFAARERPEPERGAFVAAAAGEDAEMARAVLELLAADRSAAGLLDQPPLLAGAAPDEALIGEEALIGTLLGECRLEAVIGVGGMGVVYAAMQLRPVHRRVACKVIRAGLQSREVVARFEAEREALALMSHSVIARVFDAGTTADGRPYFVMELIDGEPITDFCDRRRLSVAERLELFALVCDGVQHAHQKGVLHRDLKPSNVLVTLEGERPLPKIIDFGIAKALHQPFLDEPLVTQVGQIIGTPVYMSPEQVGFGSRDVDTRSDIYSLCVMLYELLAGVVPFEATLLQEAGFAEFERVVKTRPPESPTARLRRESVAVLAERAQQRRTSPGELSRALRGDLDAIVLKGLAKDRNERYATALELAADLRRFLRGEAVVAHAPTRGYRMRKFVGRHRAAASVSALLAILIVAFSVTVGVQAIQLRRSLAATAVERDRSAHVAGFLTQLFTLADPNISNGDSVTVRSVLDRGAAEIEASLKQQPATQAALLETMAQAYRALGLYDRSATLLGEALAARSVVPNDVVGLASTLHVRGMLEKDRGEIAAAEKDYRAALAAIAPRAAAAAERADIVSDLAVLLLDRGNYAEATQRAAEAIALRRAVGQDPSPDLASGLLELARCYQLQGDRTRAAPLYEQGLAMMRRSYGEDHVRVAEALSYYSTLLRDDGRYADAATMLRQALAIYRRVLGPQHSYVAADLVNLAGIEYSQSHYREANGFAAEALTIYERLFGADNAAVGPALLMVGNAAAALGDQAAAEQALNRALLVDRQTEGEETADVAGDYEVLGTILRDEGRMAEAEALHRKALTLRLKVLGPAHAAAANSRASLGVDEALQGHGVEGMAELEAALASLRKKYARPHVRVAATLDWLGRVRLWSGDLPGAEAAEREALGLRRQLLGLEHADTAASESVLAEILLARGDRAGAKPLYAAALAVRRQLLPPDHADVAASSVGLGAVLCGDGDLAGGRALSVPAARRLQRALAAADPRLRPVAAARSLCAGPSRANGA